MSETLTARKKRIAAEKERRILALAKPRESVLAKYAPKPPTGRCAISYELARGVFVVELRDGQHIDLPEHGNSLAVLRNILRAQALAAASGATPTLASESYPTQMQVDAWCHMREEVKVVATAQQREAARTAALDMSLGF